MFDNVLANRHEWISKDAVKALVSVIVPTYDRAELIVQTLDSVSNQSYRPIELIIVDDGSTDNTGEIVKNWQRELSSVESLKVKYVYQPNNGAPAARNRGASESCGEFIQFLDSDDLLAPDKIAAQVNAFARLGKMTAVFGDFRRFADGKKGKILLYHKSTPLNPEQALKNWLEGKFAGPQSILWRRTDFVEIGPWDESLSLNQDGEYATRFLLKGGKFAYCQNAWAYYRHYTDATTRLAGEITGSAIKSSFRVLNRIENSLRKRGEIEEYQDALAASYFELAEDSALSSKQIMKFCLDKFNQLSSTGEIPGPFIQRLARKLLGVYFKKRLFHFLRYRLGLQPFRPIAIVDSIAELYAYDAPKIT